MTSGGREWAGPLERRWGRNSAYARWLPVGPYVWSALLPGITLMAALNLAVLAMWWPSYRQPAPAIAAWCLLTGSAFGAWAASRRGLGPVAAAGAILAGPLACLLVSAQLAGPDRFGTANWAAGYSVVAVLLLPFSRPVEELVVAIAALVAVHVWLFRDGAADLREQHFAVVAGGSAATVLIGTALLVTALRRVLVREAATRSAVLDQEAYRLARDAMDTTIQERAARSDRAAAELLEGIASGELAPEDPAVISRCGAVAQALRGELRLREQRTWVQALLLADAETAGHDGDRLVVVDDVDLGASLLPRDRQTVRHAALDVLTGCEGVVHVTLMDTESPREVMFMVSAEDGPVPASDTWQLLRRRTDGTLSLGAGSRWFYDCRFERTAEGRLR